MRSFSTGLVSSLMLVAVVPASSVLAAPAAMPSESRGGTSADMASLEATIANWPAKIQKTVSETVQHYGPPTEIGMHEIVWHNEDMRNSRLSPFKTVRIKNTETPHVFPVAHTDYLMHVVDYRVDPDKASALAMFDGSVTYARTRGELSAECDTPEHNILALNLATEVASGKRSPAEARQFFAQTIAQEMKGEKPPYEQKLMFSPRPAADADRPLMAVAASMGN